MEIVSCLEASSLEGAVGSMPDKIKEKKRVGWTLKTNTLATA